MSESSNLVDVAWFNLTAIREHLIRIPPIKHLFQILALTKLETLLHLVVN